MRALITGISGSGGSYLAEWLVEHRPDTEVHGISRWHSTSGNENLRKVESKLQVHECDLMDLSAVVRTLKLVKPDQIYHLASHANVKAGFINPLAVLQNNIMGTANLLEGLRLTELPTRVQFCSTSEVYGQVGPEDVPITENCPMRPSSPYAVSKTAQDMLGWTYFRSYQMHIVRTRMFAYLNPRRTDLFATSFARQVARIEAGLQDELVHGNLDSVRTLIDVRDAMSAYWYALEYGKAGEVYNIGGPWSLSVGEFLEVLKSRALKSIPSRLNPDLLRPSDVTLQIPCCDKFLNETGWKAQYDPQESISFLLDYWRDRVKRLGEGA
jgi:GDP-4-dehydro-6-deoxy-D-mannose reductase